MISVEHVYKRFARSPVLEDISFTAGPGEIYGLIGYNGVGKTTLMKIISGIYRPDKGTVLMDGVPVYENTEKKKQCFFMTEEATYFLQSSLADMRKFYRGYYANWSDKTFYGLIDLFEVDPDMKINRFSKGMQRQAALVLAFATHSRYLFLDEAFDGLDFSIRRTMRELLKYYAEKKQAVLIVSSHNLRELEDLVDKIGMLNQGKLVFDDSTGRMRERFCSCSFQMDAEGDVLNGADVQLLERNGNSFFCILECERQQAISRLEALGASSIEVQPVKLEEFFMTERKEKRIDWKEIFE